MASGKSTALAALGGAGRGHDLVRRRRARAAGHRRGPRRRGRAPGRRRDRRRRRAGPRRRWRRKVFASDADREWLEQLLWPRVRERVAAVVRGARTAPPAAVVEVPLLFESGGEGVYHHTIAVVADEAVRAERAGGRGHEGVDGPHRPPAHAGREVAASGLHGAQRWHQRGVEGRVVPCPCHHREGLSPWQRQHAHAPRSRTRSAPSRRRGRRSAPRGAPAPADHRRAGGRRDRGLRRRQRRRPRPAGGDGARGHAAPAPRGHHPPAGLRQGPGPGPDRRGHLRGVALPRPDLARRRARADADHARHRRASSPATRAAPPSCRATWPRPR